MKIPRKDIAEMIILCFTNTSQFLSEAKVLQSQNQRFNHSVALIQFAIEELGKASILRKKLYGTLDDPVEVPDMLFGGKGSHQLKEKEAWTILSSKLRVLAEGAFDPSFFDPRDFVTEDVELSHDERLRTLFVDYEDGRIKFGVAVESQRLNRIIGGLEEEVERLKLSWQLDDI